MDELYEVADYQDHRKQPARHQHAFMNELSIIFDKVGIDTKSVLEATRQQGVKKFVYALSSSVYGDEINLPKSKAESNLPSPHSIAKCRDEGRIKQYTRHFGLDIYDLRYFNVFGRRQGSNSAYAAFIPKFIKQLMKRLAKRLT